VPAAEPAPQGPFHLTTGGQHGVALPARGSVPGLGGRAPVSVSTCQRFEVEMTTSNSQQKNFIASLFDFGSYDPRNKMKRFILEYKESAQISIRYDDELQMITYDHLQPSSPLTKDDYTTYVPDGSYEGFKWENGKWHHVENVFTATQKEPPFPNPVDFDKQKKAYTPK